MASIAASAGGIAAAVPGGKGAAVAAVAAAAAPGALPPKEELLAERAAYLGYNMALNYRKGEHRRSCYGAHRSTTSVVMG